MAFRLKLVEISISKCRRIGVDFWAVGDGTRRPGFVRALATLPEQAHGGAEPGPVGVGEDCLFVANDDPRLALVTALASNGLARTLAEPTVVTTAKREAKFHVGGELPGLRLTSGETGPPRQVGTSLTLTPIKVGSDKVTFDLRLRFAEIDEPRSPRNEGATGARPLRVREVDTGATVRFDESMVVGGMIAECAGTSDPDDAEAVAERTELVLIVTPELVLR